MMSFDRTRGTVVARGAFAVAVAALFSGGCSDSSPRFGASDNSVMAGINATGGTGVAGTAVTGGTSGGGGMVAQPPPAGTGGGMSNNMTVTGGTGAQAPVDAGTPDTADSGTPQTDAGKPPGGGTSCLDGITGFDADGPFEYDATSSGSVKLWVPQVPAGCKVPVIHLANGTGATCSAYAPVITRLASHGFLTTCYENTNTGAGTQGLMALKTAIEMYPDLADMRIGSTGHSQGGQASFIVLQFAEEEWGDQAIYAGLAMEPASGFGSQPAGGSWQSIYGKIKSPMFMFSGTADVLVSEGWVRQAFSALDDSIEAYWWSANGATHVPVPNSETQEISVPWFRWKLLGDNEACKAFYALEAGSGWDSRMQQNEVACQ